jgi:hypothetical protein
MNAFTEETTFQSENAFAQDTLQAAHADRVGVPTLPRALDAPYRLPILWLLQRADGDYRQGKTEEGVRMSRRPKAFERLAG